MRFGGGREGQAADSTCGEQVQPQRQLVSGVPCDVGDCLKTTPTN